MVEQDSIAVLIERVKASAENCELCWHLHSMIQLLVAVLEENQTEKGDKK